MKLIKKDNFFLFTGGPGSGKTTVLNELARRGFCVVPEVARAIIKQQNACGGDATHNGNRQVYCDLMLHQSIADYQSHVLIKEPVFFDRGLPDLFSYAKRFCGGERADVAEAVTHHRYNTLAFIFPAWPQIYCHDNERKQDFSEAVATYYAVKEGYTACGYKLQELPQCSVAERADIILSVINYETR